MYEASGDIIPYVINLTLGVIVNHCQYGPMILSEMRQYPQHALRGILEDRSACTKVLCSSHPSYPSSENYIEESFVLPLMSRIFNHSESLLQVTTL